MQPANGLDVVVEDLGSRPEHDLERLLLVAEEVGRQHLDGRLRQLALQRPDRGRVVLRALVGEVIQVDGGDDHVVALHLGGGVREPQRLQRGRVRAQASPS